MKKIQVSLLVLIWMLFSFTNIAGAKDVELKADLDVGYFSKYVGGTTGGNFFDHSVFQQSLKITAEWETTKLYLMFWKSYSPKGGINSDYGDEDDFIAGIIKHYKYVTIDAAYSFYNCYDLSNTKGDLHALSIRFDFPNIRKVSPYAFIEWDIPIDKEILDGGVMYKFGLMYDMTLPESLKNQTIDIDLSIGGHDGAYGKNPEPASFGRLNLSTTFHIWKVGITPEVNFQKRFGYKVRNGGMASDEIWYGVNFNVPFDLF